jgi:hypothetical protein
MSIGKYLGVLWLLLVLGFLITRCAYQSSSFFHSISSNIQHTTPIYKRFREIGVPRKVQYDQDGNPSPQEETLESKDVNDLADTTKVLHDTIYTAMPTNLSANLLVVHNTFLNKYAAQLDNDFQSFMADIFQKIQNLFGATSNEQTEQTEQETQPQN